MSTENTFEYSNFDDQTFTLNFDAVVAQWKENIHSGNQDKLISLHNEYCETNQYDDIEIFQSSDIDSFFEDRQEQSSVSQLLHKLRYFDLEKPYFVTNDYTSFSDVLGDDSPISLNALLSYIIEYDKLDELEEFNIDLESPELQYQVASETLRPR